MKERSSPSCTLAIGVVCVALTHGDSFSFTIAVVSPFKKIRGERGPISRQWNGVSAEPLIGYGRCLEGFTEDEKREKKGRINVPVRQVRLI